MILYKHTQIGYLMLVVVLVLLIIFVGVHITVSSEISSVDSGSNFFVSFIMILILFILISFATLTTSIDENCFRIKFGYGIFSRKFSLNQIASVQTVKNQWYYGWGIRLWLWPKMWIYNVSGFGAVEITMKNGKIYRVGTDVPGELETAIKQSIKI